LRSIFKKILYRTGTEELWYNLNMKYLKSRTILLVSAFSYFVSSSFIGIVPLKVEIIFKGLNILGLFCLALGLVALVSEMRSEKESYKRL